MVTNLEAALLAVVVVIGQLSYIGLHENTQEAGGTKHSGLSAENNGPWTHPQPESRQFLSYGFAYEFTAYESTPARAEADLTRVAGRTPTYVLFSAMGTNWSMQAASMQTMSMQTTFMQTRMTEPTMMYTANTANLK